MRRAIAWTIALAVLAATVAPASALADGDPASDELIGANVFYPYSPPVSAGLQNMLNSETAAASRVHFPIKVALIASPVDLGTIPSLFAKPQQYADFLDQEISFAGTKTLLLVVMPNGYGVQGLNHPATEAVTTLKPPAGSRSDNLARAAIVAVTKLAAAAGHPISAASAGSDAAGGGSPTAIEVAAPVFAAVVLSAAVLWLRQRQRGAR